MGWQKINNMDRVLSILNEWKISTDVFKGTREFKITHRTPEIPEAIVSVTRGPITETEGLTLSAYATSTPIGMREADEIKLKEMLDRVASKFKTKCLKYESGRSAILSYHEVILNIFSEHNLGSVSGYNRDYKINGREILLWHSHATERTHYPYANSFDIDGEGERNHQTNFDDLDQYSEELLYATAELYLYRPYINDPFKDMQKFAGGELYVNNYNLAASRFDMIVHNAYQACYNFWARIADLINSYFPNELRHTGVNFATVMDLIGRHQVAESITTTSAHYNWLKNFQDNIYSSTLNKKRKGVVHGLTQATRSKWDYLKNVAKEAELRQIHEARLGMPEYFKEQIEYSLQGFFHTLSMLDELNAILPLPPVVATTP